MGELRDDGLRTWFDAYVRGSLLPIFSSLAQALFSKLWLQLQYNPTDDTYPHVYEQALERLAFAVGRKAVCPACSISAHPAGTAQSGALACGVLAR